MKSTVSVNDVLPPFTAHYECVAYYRPLGLVVKGHYLQKWNLDVDVDGVIIKRKTMDQVAIVWNNSIKNIAKVFVVYQWNVETC